MCGIAGKVTFDSHGVATPDIERMNQALRHRGPDDGGVYIDWYSADDRRIGAEFWAEPAGWGDYHHTGRRTLSRGDGR